MRFFVSKSCLVLAAMVVSSPVFAGFEFTPPPKKSVMPNPEIVSEKPVAPNYSGMDVQPMPVEPVISAPLPVAPAMNAPMAAVPPPPAPDERMPTPIISSSVPMMPAPVMQPVVPVAPIAMPAPAPVKTSGLYIDPYPLMNKNTDTVSYDRIEQAVTEKAGGLHPVQLGGGMTTGANIKRKKIASLSKQPSKSKAPSSFGVSSLTPMIGNEPAPLPGYGLDKVERTDMRQYAQAVGFGKGLPIALAISQVIPAEYTHRFDGDIDAALMVDWEGGKPWNLVLNDMLREHNMRAEVQGNVVVIKETAKI